MIFSIIGLFFLFLLSAFFSGSETALTSVNRVRVKELANKGDAQARLLEKLLSDPTGLLITVLVGNNLVNIAASAITTSMAISLFGSAGVGIATGVVTLVVLVFGEITPKSLGNRDALKYAKLAAPYIYYLKQLLRPLILIFNKLMKLFLGKNYLQASPFLSEEEIIRYVNVSEEEGIIKKTERKMIKSIFAFDDTTVKEVMVPRIDMVCASEDISLEALVKLAVEKGHSRIPIYQDTIDNIIGLIYVKDLLKYILNPAQNRSLKDLLRSPYFIPESKKINNLLSEMKKSKVHMAIVLDEYGGTAGLITIEDLLEEIVGDIQDEYDLEEKQIEYLNEHEIMVDARIDLDDLNEVLPEPLLTDEDYETISGFIFAHLGYLPEAGEALKFEDLTIEIAKVKEHRIEKVKIITEQNLQGFRSGE